MFCQLGDDINDFTTIFQLPNFQKEGQCVYLYNQILCVFLRLTVLYRRVIRPQNPNAKKNNFTDTFLILAKEREKLTSEKIGNGSMKRNSEEEHVSFQKLVVGRLRPLEVAWVQWHFKKRKLFSLNRENIDLRMSSDIMFSFILKEQSVIQFSLRLKIYFKLVDVSISPTYWYL